MSSSSNTTTTTTTTSSSSPLLITLSQYMSIPSTSTLTSSLTTFILFIVCLEQISYLIKKRHLAGPPLVLPFLGTVVSLIRNPTKYWYDQAAFSAKHGFSANYVIGKFIVFIRDSELSHLIFSNVRADGFMLIGHPFGKKLFGEHNLIYMFGEEHKGLRRRFAPNFTPKALSTYTILQQGMIVKHLIKWEKLAKSDSTTPFSLRLLARDLNLETSQMVFMGPYMTPQARERFTKDYNLFNVGTMKLPIDLPGFAFHNARLAVDRLVEMLAECVGQSKMRMQRGEEPSCLTDFFVQETMREMAAAEEAGDPPPAHTTDVEMGSYLFDFLFAAQDASTSSLLWAVSLLDSHPNVLAKVRAEVASVWTPDSNHLISADLVREMKYTQAVAREVIRFRAPATLVPHIAVKDFKLTDTYTIPKGTIVFPSVFESSFQGFTEADRFDPERFNEQRQEDQVYKRNYLAFGSGPHQCVGQRYALNHLVLFIAMFSSLMDFKRHKTDGCDEIVYNPTICPKDGCSVFLSRRCARYPTLSVVE